MDTITVLDHATWYELSDLEQCGWVHQIHGIADYDPNLIIPGNSQPGGPIRWELVAQFLSYGLDLLRRDAITFTDGVGTFEYDLSSFSRRERDIAKDWFYTGPKGNPWDEELTNGRHRLAWVSRHGPKISIPIKSMALMSDRPADGYTQGDILAVRSGLAQWEGRLPQTDLNRRFLNALRERYGLDV
ncbi:Uncharacterised protein [Mycobacteroides abscessus subsp. bolletii]|uniref:hypothetical protein n=1 Tax=Mycobacteroides abscessus TaxID=36809 RepID=UPI0009A6F99B|nr:hypothetical protein [Mycobacteroides abscessus]SKS73190.1 Uncharacterised protein [Mycobacteroides abscessus subsp. bolletii]SKS83606.1 Uncharacterised protein [Mycobacteroides abscessus subsp. bolletii]